MARVELTRRYPVELQKAWNYMNDPHHWADWFVNLVSVEDPDARWAEPGDRVRFSYLLLGRKVQGELIIDERQAPTLISYTDKIPGLPDIRHTWRHVEAPGPVVTTTVVLETDERTSFFGKAFDRMLLLRALERDLRRTLDNLADIFSMGVPE
jgi:uncharacterized protein YndB with AHSA1/START domain